MIGRMKAKLTMFNVLIIVMIVTISELSAISDTEIDRLLKKLNKPALKSIKSPDGDIIDCVHLKNHPIYDHPLFTNHTIQMRPSSYPEDWENVSSNTIEQPMTQLWTVNGKCPKDSIPIIRTRKSDILRAEWMDKYGKGYPSDIPQPDQANVTANHEYAVVKVNGKFNGAKALLNVWKPYVKGSKEFSLSQIWLSAGPRSEVNTIEAGWQVYPRLYDDYRRRNPHYFIYWTVDGYKTGCYNLRCPGFVLINQEFALGASIKDVSTFNGSQHEIPLTIYKDLLSGHWWLKSGTHTLIGYWPSSLFNHLQNGADTIYWGGEITEFRKSTKHTKTHMGSGHFAQEGYKKASYVRNIETINESGIPKQPVEPYTFATNENCYNINLGNHSVWGIFFYYGGPGRNSRCPLQEI